MSRKNDSGAEIGLALLIWLAGMVPLIVLDGWVISKIWVWHVAGIFSLPALTISQAIGLSIAAAILTHQTIKNKDDDEDAGVLAKMIAAQLGAGLKSLMYLGMGYVVLLCR